MALLRCLYLLLFTLSVVNTAEIVEELIVEDNNPRNVQINNSPSSEVESILLHPENENYPTSATKDKNSAMMGETDLIAEVDPVNSKTTENDKSPDLVPKSPTHSSGWGDSHFPSTSGWQSNTCIYNSNCKTTVNNCCKCNQNYAKCCSKYFTRTEEGFCQNDMCKPCKSPGSYCVSSNQCCKIQNPDSQNITTCMNNVCCVSPSSAGCFNDADCCQPLDIISGYHCRNKYCRPCNKNQQSCNSDSECCGENYCGNTLTKDGDYDRYSICCLHPGADCHVGMDICCDSDKCDLGIQTTKRYSCVPKRPSRLSDNSLTGASENRQSGISRGGWGGLSHNNGGWGSDGGWAQDVPEKVPQVYILGTCTECKENAPCVSSTDCCGGYVCQQGKCSAVPENSCSPQCGQLGVLCGLGITCCPGLICTNAVCSRECSKLNGPCSNNAECCQPGLLCFMGKCELA